MKIIRVFPRRTSATPDDNLVRINKIPTLFDEADEIHISVAFSWDIPLAERLERLWKNVAPVSMGGPAFDDQGGDFTPGMYVKKGYVMTSRGCPNQCWFCSVWRREGKTIRTLPITEGYNLLDSNILACPDDHVSGVFQMLKEGKKKFKKSVQFSGGLEAARLKQWHVDALRELRPQQLFFAYDTPDDLEPLQRAGKMLIHAGWLKESYNALRCYVLCGWKGDSTREADIRMWQAVDAGFLPMAMVYRDKKGQRKPEWMHFAREWSRPAITREKIGERMVWCTEKK